MKEKNEAKKASETFRAKAEIAGYRWTDEPPRRRRSLSRREPALFVPILRNATRFILQTHYARIDKNETERKHRPGGKAKSRGEREGEGLGKNITPAIPSIHLASRECIRARTRQIDVYRRGMRLGSSSISGAYSGNGGWLQRALRGEVVDRQGRCAGS